MHIELYKTRKAEINRQAERALEGLRQLTSTANYPTEQIIESAYKIGRDQERAISSLNEEAARSSALER